MKMIIVIGALIHSMNLFAASDVHITKWAESILDNHFDNSQHSEPQKSENNCLGDNHYILINTNVQIISYKVTEIEGDGELSGGFIEVALQCEVLTFNGSCDNGVPIPNVPLRSMSNIDLIMPYVFQKDRFLNLGMIQKIQSIVLEMKSGKILTPIKPIEYLGCGAYTINNLKPDILDDSIVGIPN